ncbi:MAG: hypothetical protein AAB342_05100, partial [Chloroflexota bacterium]
MSVEPRPASTQEDTPQWRLEQFRVISRLASVAAGLGLIVYLAVFAATGDFLSLRLAIAVGIALALFQFSWQVARTADAERGVEILALTTIAFFAVTIYL